MNIAFWGFGSIAKRHIHNLTKVLSQQEQEFTIDVYRHSQRTIEEADIRDIVSNIFTEKEIAGKLYDVIFITNPTSMHYETIKKCIPYTNHMFIEKPVFDESDKDIGQLGLKDASVYYVACPLRYTSVFQYIKNNVDLKSVFSVRAISSSYLPDWRFGVDYRETYSAHRNLGGGVAIDLIHEWDYLTALFGMPKKVYNAGGKYSNLEIDSDDLATYIGIYETCIIELHLDYFGRKTVRELTLYTAEEVIVADLVNSNVFYLKSGKFIDLREERDAYQKREMEHFLDIIYGKYVNDSTVEHGLEVLKLAKNYQE